MARKAAGRRRDQGLARCSQTTGEVDDGEVSEQEGLVVSAGGEQDGCEQAADESVAGEQLGVLREGHEGVPRSDEDHEDEGDGRVQQVVELEGGPQRKVQDAGADGFQRVGEGGESFAAEALGPEDEGGAGGEADDDAEGRRDQAAIDSELERPGGAGDERDDADEVEELGAEPVFERFLWGGSGRALVTDGGKLVARRAFRLLCNGGRWRTRERRWGAVESRGGRRPGLPLRGGPARP